VSSPLLATLQAKVAERKQQHLYRQRKTLSTAQGAVVKRDDKTFLNFCSNDYLGLANHPELKIASAGALKRWGTGAGASHLVCGHSYEHEALEAELAEFTGRDKALLFSTGFMANLAVLQTLLSKGDALFEDRLNHASLIDGAILSGARLSRFQHNDLQHLQSRLSASEAVGKMIAVDGVYSMDGDLAPLGELADIAQQHQAVLMADDAHGFGVLGEHGAGCVEHFNLDQAKLPIVMATLGKALGSFGAFVTGSNELIEGLMQFARPYIYTTALPPSVVAASRAGLRLVQTDVARREHLQNLIALFRQGAKERGLPIMESTTAIQPLIITDPSQCLRVAEKLESKGIWVGAIRPPTVPANSSRLRITLSSGHSVEQLHQLLTALEQTLNDLDLLGVGGQQQHSEEVGV